MKPQPECEFVFQGRRVRATREGVEKALQGVEPEPVTTDWVIIHGRRYPVRQAFALAFGIVRQYVRTNMALRVLRRLGFGVVRSTTRQGAQATCGTPAGPTAPRQGGVRPRFPYMPSMPKTAEMERLAPRAIELRWSEWYRWEDLAKDDRGGKGVQVPDGTPGVYEAKIEGQKEFLVIGKAAVLQVRLKAGLVKGSLRHEAGAKIRANEDLSKVRVRWALTDRPATAEEELHLRHLERFGKLPKYTDRM
ncbi:MAG: hypothetical protein FJX75_06730 [Armatimonadetes bacterium]|nr:hypothetical protein [Armatimonadota bacterium]